MRMRSKGEAKICATFLPPPPHVREGGVGGSETGLRKGRSASSGLQGFPRTHVLFFPFLCLAAFFTTCDLRSPPRDRSRNPRVASAES